ncbi:hypothetical protein C4D60_Mb00t02410 [Musa balbisiana]|uniref:Cystatin domain-containing protein n=1 Tax=Musa balbisiana TaxID=52838 RepID=A0A4S8I6G1_MUSBA|nr:hypothetical protein C4D60_Mb00t02410 [Musa balbisiana]
MAIRRLRTFGGWKSIWDVDESHIHDIVVFAISEHNQETNEHLTWDKVVKGETQLVTGLQYLAGDDHK